MGFDKTINARIWGVTNQNADVRLTAGDSSGGTFTRQANPLRGTLVWDRCLYVLTGVSVAGGATGGSYTITIETDAVTGYTGLPIARVAGIGPNTRGRVVLTNLHDSPASPLPTHLFIDQTATGGGIWLQCYALAKQYRGTLGTAGANSAERVIQGTMLRGASYATGPFTDSRGMTEDATFTLGTTGSNIGLNRMRLWDTAFYWTQAGNSVAGTHDVDIVGTVNGLTFSIASTGTGGALDAANERLAIASNVGGLTPNPTHIIWTEVNAGGISDARVIALVKSGRGSYAKD
jgi:hypothetical protein